MTFDEYNTDENFDNDKSSLDELVKIGVSEGKTDKEIKDALSPKWQNSKKIGEFDNYYKTHSASKKEAPKEEAPKVEEMTKTTEALEKPVVEEKEEETYVSPLETEETGVKKGDRTYMNDVNAILNEEQKEELKKLSKTSLDAYNRTMANMERSGDAFKKIDDRLIEQLPTFLFKRYQNGEFGDPHSQDATLRLAYFAINNVVSKFKKLANADAAHRGKGPLFQDTESAYEKYQNTNFAKGLENRWNKYQQETQAAIDMVKQRNMSEEDALNIINKISMNNRLQTAYNMADANKKAYMIEVLSKVGDKVSNWNDQKFVNALVGAEMTGEDVGSAAALIGARAGGKVLDQLNLFDENGNLDISALKDMINIPGFTDQFKSQFGFDPTNLIPKEGEGEGTGTTLDDGTKIDPGKSMSKEELAELRAAAENLGNQLYNGDIDEEKFRSEYAKLEAVMKQHGIRNAVSGGIKSQDEYLKQIRKNKLGDISTQFEALNEKAKAGELKPSEYKEQYDKLKETYVTWGADGNALKAVDKKRYSDKDLLKYGEKAAKKKK